MAGLGASPASGPSWPAVVDLTSPNLADELVKVDERIQVLDGLLDALGRVAQLNRTLQLCSSRHAAMQALRAAPFLYTQQQAEAVLDMPVSWQCTEHVDKLRKEREELTARRNNIEGRISEVHSLHWFG